MNSAGDAQGQKRGCKEEHVPSGILLSPHSRLGPASISFLSTCIKTQFYEQSARWLSTLLFSAYSLTAAIPVWQKGCCILSHADAFYAASHLNEAQKERAICSLICRTWSYVESKISARFRARCTNTSSEAARGPKGLVKVDQPEKAQGTANFWEGLSPFCSLGVYISPCREYRKPLARLGFEFMLLEPCSNFSTKATYKCEAIASTEIRPTWFCPVLSQATAHLRAPASWHRGRTASTQPPTQHRWRQSNASLER